MNLEENEPKAIENDSPKSYSNSTSQSPTPEKNTVSENHHHEKPHKKKGISTALLIFLLIVLLIGGGIAFAVYKYQENQKNTELMTAENREKAKENFFSLKAYDKIPENYKEHIYYFLEYNNFNDGTYFLTKIEDRAKDVFAFGDFTNDDNDEDDLAVVLELNDFKTSKLVLFNHKGELLYTEDFSYLPTIKSFKVGSKIYMDTTELVPAPVGGLILQYGDSKNVLLYDKKTKTFSTYYQYTNEEIESMKYEEEYDSDETETEEATPTDSKENSSNTETQQGVLGIF